MRAMAQPALAGWLGSRVLFHYESRRTGDVELTPRMVAIAARKRRYGYRRIHVPLRRKSWPANLFMIAGAAGAPVSTGSSKHGPNLVNRH